MKRKVKAPGHGSYGMRAWLGLLTAALTLFLSTSTIVGADYHNKAEKLEKLRAEIAQITEELRSDRRREDSLMRQLRHLDERIGQVAAKVRELEEKIQAQRHQAAKLRARYQRRSRELARERQYLARTVVTAYMLGQHAYLRLLLNQKEPERLDRVRVYYSYLNKARIRHIHETVQALRSIHTLEQKLQTELAQLARLKRQRLAKQQSLQRERRQRAALLQRLRRRIASQGQRLQRLQANEAELSQLVRRLRQSLADISAHGASERPFRTRKGQLRWPLKGQLIAPYGAKRSTNVHWHGVFIAADAGSAVHAVAPGRVVFADWLRGLGLLLIIDHGGGYMTLYGHNQSVYTELGDWVEAGEIIATVGLSGGNARAGLYFEVRVHGKPVNPLVWLRPREQHG